MMEKASNVTTCHMWSGELEGGSQGPLDESQSRDYIDTVNRSHGSNHESIHACNGVLIQETSCYGRLFPVDWTLQ